MQLQADAAVAVQLHLEHFQAGSDGLQVIEGSQQQVFDTSDILVDAPANSSDSRDVICDHKVVSSA